MTIIDRVAPQAPTGTLARERLSSGTGSPAAAIRTRVVADRLDELVARFDGDGTGPAGPIGVDELALLSAVARAILDAGIERGAEEHDTIQALAVRRTAWVHARRDQFVIAHLLDGVTSGPPVEAAWYRHLAVHEHAERGLRHVKTAIGDSAVAPDPELATYEHDLRALARYGPGASELWDHLVAPVMVGSARVDPVRR